MIIEICVIIIALMFWYFLLVLSNKRKLKKLRKRYDEKEDKSKQGEERSILVGRTTGKKRDTRFAEREPSLERPSELERGGILPPTSSTSAGKNRKSPRGIFRKLRRR